MSLKLVQKFLRQDDQAVVSIVAAENNRQPKKRSRRRRDNDDAAIATEEDILQATVHSMLYLDNAMVTQKGKTDSKNGIMKRINEDSKKAKKRRKKLVENAIVGNSRSSSSQMRLPAEPSFNKKRYKKAQEEKRLKEIAKLLKKQRR